MNHALAVLTLSLSVLAAGCQAPVPEGPQPDALPPPPPPDFLPGDRDGDVGDGEPHDRGEDAAHAEGDPALDGGDEPEETGSAEFGVNAVEDLVYFGVAAEDDVALVAPPPPPPAAPPTPSATTAI